jgi:hypothetical protein
MWQDILDIMVYTLRNILLKMTLFYYSLVNEIQIVLYTHYLRFLVRIL